MEATFKIDGMSCEHCQARVRAALLEQAGVNAANVSLANGTATVLYDEQVTSPYALLQAIDRSCLCSTAAVPRIRCPRMS